MISAAKADGEFMWYANFQQGTIDAIVGRFQDEYGIRINAVKMISSDLHTRVRSELDADNLQVDVISSADGAFLDQLKADGVVNSPDPADFPELSEEFILPSSTVVAVQAAGAAFNTKKLDWEPSTWQDLLDPRLKNDLILADPRGSIAWAQMWSMVLHDERLGADYIKALADQKLFLVNSGIPGLELTASGERAAVIGITPSPVEAKRPSGAPVDYFMFDGPSFSIMNYTSQVADSPHQAAGRFFTHWLSTKEGSQMLNSLEHTTSPLGALEGTVPPPASGIQFPPAADQVSRDLPEILKLFGI